ncbi:PIR Superfamily Protein [Plasmodium ovale curtisi]|uniref:PIR Superfamily Protein n=1 Tax=Plasmodium ovale curtisi TaxID=864141 RepID=A0A1A8WFF8_PLAOA|nr:PIR Superfamily Protein [Plasmodium ovale curtisi]
MGCINGSGKENYTFLRNAHYYGNLPAETKNEALEQNKKKICDHLSDTNLSEDSSARNICEYFVYMYNYLNKFTNSQEKEKSITDEDCHFMNYWLNVKLRDKNIDAKICVNDFYGKLKSKDESFFSSTTKLENHLHVIDTDTLENMKLLYKLYDNAVKIISIIRTQYYTDEEEKNNERKSCSEYTNECDKNFKEAMDRCLNSNVDFYNALKNFKDGYKIITEPSSNESNVCNSSEFSFFPDYDAVLEKKANAIKISSTLSVLSLALPLIYKYTPFGPFLRTKINMVKDRWINPNKNEDELLPLSTDIEVNISDNEEYNIGYYSETN